jgi:hypothetical protein
MHISIITTKEPVTFLLTVLSVLGTHVLVLGVLLLPEAPETLLGAKKQLLGAT